MAGRVTIMVMPPRIGPKRPIRFFLAEHREHSSPTLTQETIGNRIRPAVDKGTVSRWEKAARTGRLPTGVVAAYAEALGKTFGDMLRPPDAGPSLDSLVDKLAPEDRGRVIGYVEGIAKRAS
jgi:hypothetical protein